MKRQVVFLASIDWNAPWQRHQALAAAFAADGAEVFFVENAGMRDATWSDTGRIARRLSEVVKGSRRRPAKNPAGPVKIVAPFTLPPTKSVFRGLNSSMLVPALARNLRKLGLRSAATVFAYLPTSTTLALLSELDPAITIYDSVDHFHHLPGRPRDLETTEAALLKRSQLVLATSDFLRKRLRSKHPNVVELHHGVSDEFFDPGYRPPRAYRKLCYFGTIWEALDFSALDALSGAGYDVTLIGPVKSGVQIPKGVKTRPPIPPKALATALREFDVLLLPYAENDYNRGVVPSKTYECLATGRPVIAGGLAGLERPGDYFYFSRTPAQWPAIVEKLAATESDGRWQSRVEFARRHSTAAQFDRLKTLIAETAKC